jgi:hypothetical protein
MNVSSCRAKHVFALMICATGDEVSRGSPCYGEVHGHEV